MSISISSYPNRLRLGPTRGVRGDEKEEGAEADPLFTAENTPTKGQVEGKAEEARQSANQTMGQAAGKAQELKDEASKKAQQ